VIYVVGERTPDGANPSTRRRLASLCDVDVDELMASVVWINLFDQPGTDADRYAAMIERAAADGDAIVVLGRRAQRAFALGKPDALTVITRHRGPIVVALPHPSGRNRWWNDPAHVVDAEALMRRVWGGHSR
jgi:hypothetical protein